MLQIIIPATEAEMFDEEANEFRYQTVEKAQPLRLEHSLVSLSKWESKWCKPFFTKDEKTTEEIIDYIRCMTLDKNIDPTVYERLSKENIAEVTNYIYAPMTATTFSNVHNRKSGGKETITSELIYYWMITLNIPVEFERWHINRLITLIRVCEIKNTPPKKMSRNEIMSRNAALNASRRKQFKSKG